MSFYLPVAEMPANIYVFLTMGAAVGFLSCLFGIGGGFLMTPLLIFSGIPGHCRRHGIRADRRLVGVRRPRTLADRALFDQCHCSGRLARPRAMLARAAGSVAVRETAS